MSEAACKAAICSHCLYALIVPEVRERAEIISILAANDQLSEKQLEAIIEVFDRFMPVIKDYEDANKALLLALEQIVPI